MKITLINLAYLLAAALFIFGLKRLQSPATARGGNQLAGVGMLIAVVVTLFLQRILTPVEMIIGLVAGGLIGTVLARRIQMTSMPELEAAFNGFGGLASALVASAEVAKRLTEGTPLDFSTTFTIMLSVLIGMVTFSGSFVAFGKLSGKISGNPVNFPGMRLLTLLIVLGSLGAVIWTLIGTPAFPGVSEPVVWGLASLLVLSLLLGILLVIPIGGADMPVVVAL
ncbi:MAG: NAD(P)(+) transhydrogenase (Re/Si-specific) subunit beta, partial [Rhodothermales bacterium]